jgi:TetR/AcrR family fatty acid metabolism transcriptional regulator
MVDRGGGNRNEKRARIIDAAVRVFADRGFHQARVTDIAAQAGVADGTIYLYFRNKEDLLLTIFEEKMGEINEGIRRELEGVEDVFDRIRLFARYHFRLVQQERALAEVLQVELRLSNKFLKEYRPKPLWAYLDQFAEILRAGQAAGKVRADVEPFVAKWAFFGALDELAMQWVLARGKARFNLDKAADTVADIFIKGIAA